MEPDFRWDYRKVSRVLNRINDGLERLLLAMDRIETLMRRSDRSLPDEWFRVLRPPAAEALRPEPGRARRAEADPAGRHGRTGDARRAAIRRRSGFVRKKRK
jgi:hypothetical protein